MLTRRALFALPLLPTLPFPNSAPSERAIFSALGRIRLSSIISGYTLALGKRDDGRLFTLCPFHGSSTERSARTLEITNSTGTYHCAECGAHGDVFTFLAAIAAL